MEGVEWDGLGRKRSGPKKSTRPGPRATEEANDYIKTNTIAEDPVEMQSRWSWGEWVTLLYAVYNRPKKHDHNNDAFLW